MHLKWSSDYTAYLIMLIPLIFAGWLMLRAIDKDKAREKARDRELAATYPNYAEWKKLTDRWRTFGSGAFMIVMMATIIASNFPVLKPAFRWMIPIVLFTWAPAEICALVLWAGRNEDWRSYLGYIWRPMLYATLIAMLYWQTQELMEGLPWAIKLAQAVVGMALSPLFLRLSGFLELDKFYTEPRLERRYEQWLD